MIELHISFSIFLPMTDIKLMNLQFLDQAICPF